MIHLEFTTTNPVLHETRQAVPEMSIKIETEQPIPTEATGNRLFFWAFGGDYTAFEQALDDDSTVTDPRVLEDTDGSRLYRVILTEEGMKYACQPFWVELDVMVIHAESSGDGWFVRMRFPDRSSISEFRSRFVERDLPFRVTGVYESSERPDSKANAQITNLQRQTIIRAHDAGYFDVPRETSLVELAEKLGVSDTAVSQRLRRGLGKIVESEIQRG